MSGEPRPYAHLNCALTACGAMAAPDGTRLPISTREDWRRVHLLRERYDAVAIGALTWLRDRPRLSVRRAELGREPLRQPSRVVFAGGQPCAPAGDGRRTFLVGRVQAGREVGHEGSTATLIPCTGRALGPPLAALYRHGVRSLLVEGGRVLLRSFLAQGCYDRLTVFVRAGRREEARAALAAAFPDLPDLRELRELDGCSGPAPIAFAEGFLLDLRPPDAPECAPECAPPPEGAPCE
jgi:riboflavin biosynthesis pyrimidine reductase